MKKYKISIFAFTKVFSALAYVAVLTVTTTISAPAFANDLIENQSGCETIDSDSEEQKCTDDQKRSQLKSVKLRPEIRKEQIKKESSFHPSALYPFIVGAGRIQ